MPKVIFINSDESINEINANIGENLLEIAHLNNINLEGACEGSLACSTCHLILDPIWYSFLSEALEEEEDMLDLAFDLTRTSRLGCQIIMSKKLDGIILKLPEGSRNIY
jgi:2Fe-2S ferredoxin